MERPLGGNNTNRTEGWGGGKELVKSQRRDVWFTTVYLPAQLKEGNHSPKTLHLKHAWLALDINVGEDSR